MNLIAFMKKFFHQENKYFFITLFNQFWKFAIFIVLPFIVEFDEASFIFNLIAISLTIAGFSTIGFKSKIQFLFANNIGVNEKSFFISIISRVIINNLFFIVIFFLFNFQFEIIKLNSLTNYFLLFIISSFISININLKFLTPVIQNKNLILGELMFSLWSNLLVIFLLISFIIDSNKQSLIYLFIFFYILISLVSYLIIYKSLVSNKKTAKNDYKLDMKSVLIDLSGISLNWIPILISGYLLVPEDHTNFTSLYRVLLIFTVISSNRLIIISNAEVKNGIKKSTLFQNFKFLYLLTYFFIIFLIFNILDMSNTFKIINAISTTIVFISFLLSDTQMYMYRVSKNIKFSYLLEIIFILSLLLILPITITYFSYLSFLSAALLISSRLLIIRYFYR